MDHVIDVVGRLRLVVKSHFFPHLLQHQKSIHEIQMCGLVVVLRDAACIMCRLLEKNKTEQPIVVVGPMT